MFASRLTIVALMLVLTVGAGLALAETTEAAPAEEAAQAPAAGHDCGMKAAAPAQAETTDLTGAAPAPAIQAEKPGHQVAAFDVGDLAKEGRLKELTMALAEEPGVLMTGLDKEKGYLKVVFDGEKTKPEAILKTLSAKAEGAKLVSVGEATKEDLHDCARCPQAAKCGKKTT